MAYIETFSFDEFLEKSYLITWHWHCPSCAQDGEFDAEKGSSADDVAKRIKHQHAGLSPECDNDRMEVRSEK